jgi:hypothetical protein
MLHYRDSNLQRLLSVLEGTVPDRVPYLDFLFSRAILENVLARPVGYEVTERADGSTKIVVDPHDYVDFLHAIGQDLAGFLVLAPDDYRCEGTTITKAIDFVETWDAFRRVERPSVDTFWPEYADRFHAMAWHANECNMGVTILTGAFFQDAHQLIGFENFMLHSSEENAFVDDVLDFFTDIYEELARRICGLGVPLFMYTDNIAYNQGSFINPRIFKEKYIPRMERILAPARNAGIPIVFDSDGDIEWMIEDLIRLKISAIHPIDPGGMDIYEIKRKYGDRITIMGNVGQDFPLSEGTVDDVVQDVRRRIAVLGRNGRYVIKSSHDVGDNVRVENFCAMIETIHNC